MKTPLEPLDKLTSSLFGLFVKFYFTETFCTRGLRHDNNKIAEYNKKKKIKLDFLNLLTLHGIEYFSTPGFDLITIYGCVLKEVWDLIPIGHDKECSILQFHSISAGLTTYGNKFFWSPNIGIFKQKNSIW